MDSSRYDLARACVNLEIARLEELRAAKDIARAAREEQCNPGILAAAEHHSKLASLERKLAEIDVAEITGGDISGI